MKLFILSFWVICLPNLLSGQGCFVDKAGSLRLADPLGRQQGMAVADFDQDGDEDIYTYNRLAENRLYENLGDGTFRNVAPGLGLHYTSSTRAAVWGDLNNDGWPDLYLANYQQADLLFLNLGPDVEGRIQFEEISQKAGISNRNEPRSVYMADLNQDGWLDIYVCNYRMPNRLYLNEGNLQFREAAAETGMAGNDFSMSALFWDYDRDGDTDVYLVHDFYERNQLWQNQGAGTFIEKGAEVGLAVEAHGMGVDAADINQDGWLDLYITDLDENFLFLNEAGHFRNIAAAAGVDDPGMGWGCFFLDANNDGWQDIYLINDSYFAPFPNVLYINQGDLTFVRVDTGQIASKGAGLGGATADFNQDGALDIIVANQAPGEGNEYFENTCQEGNWLSVILEGTKSNRTAVGAAVEIRYGAGLYQRDELMAGNGYASQSSPRLHFGLGEIDRIQSLSISWPGGGVDVYTDLDARQLLRFTERAATPSSVAPIDVFGIAPLPFRERCQIDVLVREAGHLSIRCMDINGQVEAILLSEFVAEGLFQFKWNQVEIPAGIHLLALEWEQSFLLHSLIIKH